MKFTTTKDGQKAQIIDTHKRVEVIPTDKHPYFSRTGKKTPRRVPENMIPHLIKKGMIEDPAKKGKKE